MKKITPILFFILAVTNYSNAQKTKNLSIAATSETASFPFTRYAPIHPGAEIGTALRTKEKEKSIRTVNIYLGAYYHKKIENGFYLRADYTHTLKIKKVIGIDLPVGLGYLQSFYPGKLYELDKATGEFNLVNQLGKPAIITNLGFGFTYLGSDKLQPFVRHESMLDFPLYNGPMAIRTFIKFGVNYKF